MVLCVPSWLFSWDLVLFYSVRRIVGSLVREERCTDFKSIHRQAENLQIKPLTQYSAQS